MTQVGKWTLLEIVGQGAAATVWRATDFERTVTVKVADANDAKARQSLAHEGRILKRLDHPTLPRLIEIVETPPALVFESPPAQTYSELLAKGTLWTLPLSKRLDTLSVIAAALDWLHDQNIIHRDVKPAHMTVTDPPLLFDFGIAQMITDTNPPDPDAGTAAYMPPPGEPVSPARDAYAFAVTTYELLLGAHPLLVAADRDIAPGVLRQRAAGKVQKNSWRKPSAVPHWELPPDLRSAGLDRLDELFTEALGTPEKRPARLALWMGYIRACIPPGEDSLTVAPEVLPAAFEPAHTAHEVASSLRTDGISQSRTWRAAVVALALVAILVLVMILLRR